MVPIGRALAISFLLAVPNAFPAPDSSERWLGSWATPQQIPEAANALARSSLENATLRQVVHLSAGGSRIRVRISNAFGTTPLQLLAVHVARPPSPATSRIDPASDRPLTFNGRFDVLIPAGADYFSDPLNYQVAPLSDLTVTMQFAGAPEQQTGHPGSRATSYVVAGMPVSSPELEDAQSVDHWYFLSGVDVERAAPAAASAIVALGDSITDGHGATTNGNDRWTDDLAVRLQRSPSTSGVSVLNAGIGGNRLLEEGKGPNALARFDRDVRAQSRVRYLIVLEGINDLGTLTRTAPATDAQHKELVSRMTGAYSQMILRAHAQGIEVIGATVLPFMGADYYHPDSANEADRQAVNAWIRAPGHFDAMIDFDRIMADKAQPDRMRPDYDSGDHLHPSAAGYHAMADGIDLRLFGRR